MSDGMSNTGQALAMLAAFESVGAATFNVFLLDQQGGKVSFHRQRQVDEVRRRIGPTLAKAERDRHSVIIRPYSETATLIQLDDLDAGKVKRLTPFSFLTFETSPGNFQAWVAVEKDAPKDFKLRLKRGAGNAEQDDTTATQADTSATESTRIAGSRNFKPERA